MVGFSRTRPALLVEVSSEYHRAPDLTESVWNAVKRANATASGPSRVSRELILITDIDRLFVRTAKGSVVRKSSIAAYEQDIENLYDKFNTTRADARKIDWKECNQAQSQGLIRSVVAQVVTTPSADDSANLYLLGLDSLSTVDVITALSYRVGNEPWLVPNILYTNPSIEALASAIIARTQGRTVDNDISRPARLRDTLASLMSGFPSVDNSLSQDEISHYVTKAEGRRGLSVVVTGTTGSLGSAFVKSLIDTLNIERVICLNRSGKAEAQWKARLASLKSPQRDTVPVVFHTIDFTDARLALADDDLRQVEACDIFIYNAWRVDFNLDLSSFQDNLQGLRNILDIIAQAENTPKLVFMSSISSVSSLSHVPEQAIELETACAPMGYGESKWIAERMIDQAAAQSQKIRAIVLRLDQISGSRRPGGASWPATEAFPGIMQTSKSLGLIPDDLAAVHWIPIDEVTRCILELSISESGHRGEAAYYNVTNPHATKWHILLDPLKEYCGREAELVDLRTWVNALARFDHTDKQQLTSKPALKVMSFMKHLAENEVQHQRRVDIEKSTSHSPSLAAMKPTDQGDLRQWLASL